MISCYCHRTCRVRTLSRYYSCTLKVLGIESSCDDTSAAVVNGDGKVLGEGHFSQSRLHVEAGGIIPQTARNLHSKYVKIVVENAMKQSSLDFKDLDAIAVTVKPGLIMSLHIGLEYAKDLCTLYNKPLIPIHHMEAHALTGRLIENINFPFLTFLISGGHCLLALVKSVNEFYTLGNSLDSSPGQIMDKVARRAKLNHLKKLRGLVGGAAIEKAAIGGDPNGFKFPVRVMSKKNGNFSFSGLLNMTNCYIKNCEKELKLNPDQVIPGISDLCASLQWNMSRHMCQGLEVIMQYVKEKNLIPENERCLVVSGGVASNNFFRKSFKFVCDHYNYRIVIPPQKLCTDNGVMIAWNGVERLRENLPVVQPNELPSVIPQPQCPLGENLTNDVEDVIRKIRYKSIKLKRILEEENQGDERKETG